MKKILLVEDDIQVCTVIKKGLIEAGFHVEVANDGESGLSYAISGSFDIVILDLMLPKLSGMDLCRQLRQKSGIPILMLTALGTTENIANGLNVGADDYLVKPFKFIELIARLNALIRRYKTKSVDYGERRFNYEGIEIDDLAKEVTYNGVKIGFTSTEYKLLFLLIQNPNKVFTRQEFLEQVWGISFELGTNVVDVYVNYIRKKLDKVGCPRYIQTVVGMGYVLRHELEYKA